MGLELIASALATKRGASRSVHRRRPQSVAHALQGKLVLRIEVQRGAELSHRFHRLILEQVFVPLFEVNPGQMLACKFLRRQVFDVLRDQVRGA